jgi:non-heme chloroperoxidase
MLNPKNAIHVGHSTGGGEVARYIGRHGSKRVAKAVLIGVVPLLMLKTAAKISEAVRESFWLQGMLASFSAATLILHGDDDRIVPIGAAAMHSSKARRR